MIRIGVKGIRTIGRNTQGVRIMALTDGGTVSAVAKAVSEGKEESIAETTQS